VKLYDLFRTVAAEYGVELDEIGGTKNHVHILFNLPPKIALATLVRVLKAKSSKWINYEGHLFAWQEGYGGFSVSASNLDAAREYIRNQEEHHRTRSYEEEFAALCHRYGVKFTPEKVFG
jgi:REP element-mobilizing transposase RayT